MIIENIIGSIHLGLLAAFLITAVIFVACMVISRKCVQANESLLVLGGLFVYSAVLCTMMVGGLYAESYVEDMCDTVGELTDKSTEIALSPADFNGVKDLVAEEYPSYKKVLDKVDANELKDYLKAGDSVADYLSDEINDTIDKYIRNCFYWLIGGLVTGITAILLIGRNQNGDYKGSKRSIIVQRRPRVNTYRRR